MKITQIREKDGVEALSVLDFNLLIEKIKTEIKTRRQRQMCIRDRPSPAFCFTRRILQFCRKTSQSNTRCRFRTCKWREADESI